MNDGAPQNLEAEENVLGAILLAQTVPHTLFDLLSPNMFYRESHSTIFSAMLGLSAQAKPTSPIAVADELTKWGKLDNVGGSSRIAELAALMPTVTNAPHYAKIVRDKYVLRGLLDAGQRIARLAEKEQGEPEDLIRAAEEILHSSSDQTTTLSAVPITEGLDELLDNIRLAYKSKTPITGTPTGFHGLDLILHGLWPSQLVLLAARTGQGKSTLALNIGENVADSGLSVLLFTLEMSRPELQIRSLARAGRIDSDRLSTGLVTAEEAARIPAAVEIVKARGPKLLIHDDGLTSAATLASVVRRHHERDPLGLVIVDYIGLMQGVGENQTQRIASISRVLKLLAQNMKLPILALSQMNRKQDERSDKEPMLSDLRDSGSLEQDADVVLFLHRESDHDVNREDDGTVKLIVAKNRRGKSGYTELMWNKSASRFLTPSHRPGESP